MVPEGKLESGDAFDEEAFERRWRAKLSVLITVPDLADPEIDESALDELLEPPGSGPGSEEGEVGRGA